ncbi:MAG: hypothetical protein ACJA1A_001779 [Saprospiraceae bacterium]|jgi:hypothetical protein
MGKKIIIRSFAALIIACGVFQDANAQYVTQVSGGSIVINGDIEPVRDALNYFSFGISRELKNNLLVEAKFGFGKAYGLSPELAQTSSEGGYLVEEVYNVLGENSWYPAYRNNHLMLDFSLNYRPELGIEWLRLLGGAGLGISKSTRSLNLLGFENTFYDRDFSTLTTEDRKAIIKSYYDVTYETPFDEGSDITPHLSLQLGLQFRLKANLFLHIEFRHHITTSDYLDVLKYSDPTTETGNNDSVSMISIGFSGYLNQKDEKLSTNN